MRAKICGVVVAMLANAASAHEIGTTRVTALFQPGGEYRIEIATDAAALAEKLAAAAGSAWSGESRPERLQSLLVSGDQTFRQRVKVSFDIAEVRPAISYSAVPGEGAGAGTVAHIRLTGRIPNAARQFSWNYGWTFASYALTIQNETSANATTEWLEGGQPSKSFALAAPQQRVTRLAIAWRYLRLGFTHIVPLGFDHVLFVLGIYLLSGRVRSILWQVSAFTVAHSITLGLSMYGLVAVSSRIVEPMIAVSIAYIAIENLFSSEMKAWRVAVVFGFGLLHGMGFAGALKELGLPRSEFVTALLTFNVGVELGQLAVIGTAFLLVGWHCAHRGWYRNRIVVPASMLIACTAVYWTVQRLSL